MEELSKSQIVLLTLLVSFVTSIATGIVTVSLMDQAPPSIAQTVNRIIERTVEKVVPSTAGQSAAVVTTEKTVIVKESDLIVQAVEKITPSLVRVYTNSAVDSVFLGLGIVLDAEGSIIVDSAVLPGLSEVALIFSDGTSLSANVSTNDESTGIAFLKSATTTADGKAVHFTPVALSVSKPVLGQTVVVLSGKSIPRITDGLVTALIPRATGEDSIIDSNVAADFIMGGSPLISTEGVLLGISTSLSRASSQSGFIPASVLVGKDKKSEEPVAAEKRP